MDCGLQELECKSKISPKGDTSTHAQQWGADKREERTRNCMRTSENVAGSEQRHGTAL